MLLSKSKEPCTLRLGAPWCTWFPYQASNTDWVNSTMELDLEEDIYQLGRIEWEGMEGTGIKRSRRRDEKWNGRMLENFCARGKGKRRLCKNCNERLSQGKRGKSLDDLPEIIKARVTAGQKMLKVIISANVWYAVERARSENTIKKFSRILDGRAYSHRLNRIQKHLASNNFILISIATRN